MSDLLGISSSAVTTYQRALGVVSNNIANAATEGYTRQDVSLESSPSQNNGKVALGTGVIFSAVKRQYDAFVESNLRNSNSDLQSQKPMVDYTNRIVDVMGGQTSGLSSALDQFFSSTRALSADPASTVLRSSFLRDAEGLASRFQQLSAQLDLVDNETRDAVKSTVTQMNALAGQLGSVNQQLGKFRDLSQQPPELLDQRDQLLLKLSEFTRLNTRFAQNGEVTVSLGTSITRDVIVDGKNVTQVDANFASAAAEHFTLVLDPYGDPKPLAGVSSGELAGLISFREQVLNSTHSALDNLAQVLAREVNTIHTQGVDATGQRGSNLFTIDTSQAHASAGLKVAITDPLKVCAASSFRVIEDANNPGTEDATVSYSAPSYGGADALDQVLVNNGNISAARNITVPSVAGVTAVAAVPAGMQDVTLYLDTLNPGQQLQLITRDGRHLAGQALSLDQQKTLLSPSSGFEAGASYSAQYLNAQGSESYRNTEVFYGARAAAQVLQQFDSQGNAIDPLKRRAVLQGSDVTPGWAGLPAGDYVRLNGKSLGALRPATGSSIQANDVASWLNAAGITGVTATASNTISTPINQLQTQKSLVLNGVEITPPAGTYTTVQAQAQAMADAINNQQNQSHVSASVNTQGLLVLSNTSGHEGEDIQITSLDNIEANALGINNGTYGGSVRLDRAEGDSGPIELSLGTQGDASVLSRLGLAAGINQPSQFKGAVLQGGSISTDWAGLPSGNYFTLNGKALGALSPATGSSLQASDVASWLNAASVPGITAVAGNEIRIPAGQFKLRESLTINGTLIGSGNGFATVQALADSINTEQGSTFVSAHVGLQGELILDNSAGHEGENIDISGLASKSPNALGLAGGVYGGQIRLQRADGDTQPIELGIGSQGDPSMLAKLGLRTQIHVNGQLPDDALVFVTGAGTAAVSASYSGSASDSVDRLRSSPMQVLFTSDTHYQLIDKKTGTLLAERDYDASTSGSAITYQGLTLHFSKSPVAGDKFTIDGNRDGTGDNQTLLEVSALENRNVVGSKTLGAAYIDHVNDMGNIARQATIVQSSLKVVHDQAASSRDQVSGVSLDEEATNLIRFQQAYQASAKVLQVASQLFDAMLQIH